MFLEILWAHGASGNTPALQAGIEGSTPSGSTILDTYSNSSSRRVWVQIPQTA